MTQDKEDAHYTEQAKRREIHNISLAAMIGLLISGHTRGGYNVLATEAISMGRSMYQALDKAGLIDKDD